MCCRVVLILKVSFSFVVLFFVFFFAYLYAAPSFSQMLTTTIQLNWQPKDTAMLWEHIFPCYVKDERIIFLSNSHSRPRSYLMYICMLAAPSKLWVCNPHLCSFSQLCSFSGCYCRQGQWSAFSAYKWVPQSKKQWSIMRFRVNCWCFPIK